MKNNILSLIGIGIVGLFILIFIGLLIWNCVFDRDITKTCIWHAWESATYTSFGWILENIRNALDSLATSTTTGEVSPSP